MSATTPASIPGNPPSEVHLVRPDRVRIVQTPGVRNGKPRIDGHRITVADIAIGHERQGLTPDEIVDAFPTLTLSDIHAALAYYFENRDWIDADIRESEVQVDALRAGSPSILDKVRHRPAPHHAPDDSLPPR
jgi:uncharacterized protein (DUF433 family)